MKYTRDNDSHITSSWSELSMLLGDPRRPKPKAETLQYTDGCWKVDCAMAMRMNLSLSEGWVPALS